MTLDQVIELLSDIKKVHGGDIPVFVNGEYGESEPELAKSEHFALGEADITLGFGKDELPEWLPQKNKAMQIGGW